VREQVGDQITNAQWDPLSGYGDVVLETDGSDTVQAQYLLGNDALLAQWRGGSTASYLLDGQGSVRGLTDASGAVTDRYRYDAFGALTEQQGSTVNPYRFTGQRWDAVSGLYSLRARFYDPGQGRFLSRDTAGLDQSDPVEWNRYGYARNNPTTWSDPSGNMALLGYGIGVIHGARNGALIGAAGGLAYGGFSYIAARIGWCGSPAQAWALEVNPFLYIGQMISVGAAFGAVFGGVAALGPWGSIIAGGTGFVLGGAGVIHALQDIMAHSLNACNAAELTLSLVGMAAGAGQAAGGWKGRGGPNPPEPGPGPGPGKGKGKSPPAEDPPGKAPPAGPPAKDPPGKGSPPGPPAKDPPPGPPAKDPPGKDLPPGPPGKDLPPGPPAGDPPGPPAKDPPGAPGAGGDDGTPPGGPGGDGPKKSPRGPGTGGNPGGVLLVNGPILTEGIVYRRGGFSYKNFTPRPGVDDGINGGLSTYDTLDAVTSEGQRVFEPKDPYQIIDIGRLGKGLIAVRDNDPPGHVKIIPANQLLETLQEWISTRDIGGHPLTQELMNARIGNGRIPKD
jgi:RHS repeat-associated protein